MRRLVRLFAILLCGCLITGVAQAQVAISPYVDVTVANVMKAMLRAGALDGSEAAVRDDYLIVNECQLYSANYRDEFQLQRLREATGKLIDQQRASWPNGFLFVSPLQLDRYDFERGQFMLAKASALTNVNSFQLLTPTRDATCDQRRPTRFPDYATIRIDQPVTLAGIPLERAAAEALLHRLEARSAGSGVAGGATVPQRTIYARFSFAASFMPPVTPETRGRYRFDGRLMAIELFEDEKLTQPLWKLTR